MNLMHPDTTSNLQIDTIPFFTECLTKFKNGDDKSKMEVAISVQSKILSDESKVGEMSACVVSSGLLEELCCTLSEPCSDQLFVCVTGVVSLVVSGASLPVRTRVSSLLPSLVGLISVCLLFSSHLSLILSCDKSENGVGEAATRAIGHLCSVCLSSNDVEGILNCGIVEGLCSQCLELISSSTGNEKWKNGAMALVGGLDALCTGLSDFISSQKDKKVKENKTGSQQPAGVSENEEESEFSLLSRSSSALSLIETTLGEMLAVIQHSKKTGNEETWTRQVQKEIGGILLIHFPHSFTPRREKAEGVIGRLLI
ncbi:hypothetical protein BLNAU_12389 [Blattamonas nauphoetae]|uniref:Uncharacterized protein n=1 Tax=Blattamonas nauphoetae TaxID=2049346 RepID=A0ABQ9XNF3_9EUKA|nr:hypothetical protein BLNAU_12389 [Blattamonas nauphoetae]